ncbi:hypothetical protein YPD27_3370 [Yersinia pestis KIM D27]|nr:hypothetical protein YpK1973002_2772 [Yersinia pestis biovar Mediaevalis str. K1973002]EFA49065.1 hypothetical protein YPD27_3370 [Yersinia pestis KIM D27]
MHPVPLINLWFLFLDTQRHWRDSKIKYSNPGKLISTRIQTFTAASHAVMPSKQGITQ